MSQYTFDGQYLKEGSNTIANVRGNNIRKGSTSDVIGNIHGGDIRKGTGTTTLFNIKHEDIRQGTGSTVIATMKDVDKVISGPGRDLKAALWVLCCR